MRVLRRLPQIKQSPSSTCDWRHTSAQLRAGGWKVIFCLNAAHLVFVRSVGQDSREIQGHSLPGCVHSRKGKTLPRWYGNTAARALTFTQNKSVKHKCSALSGSLCPSFVAGISPASSHWAFFLSSNRGRTAVWSWFLMWEVWRPCFFVPYKFFPKLIRRRGVSNLSSLRRCWASFSLPSIILCHHCLSCRDVSFVNIFTWIFKVHEAFLFWRCRKMIDLLDSYEFS